MKRNRKLPLWLIVSAKKYKTRQANRNTLIDKMNKLTLSNQNASKKLTEKFDKLNLATEIDEIFDDNRKINKQVKDTINRLSLFKTENSLPATECCGPENKKNDNFFITATLPPNNSLKEIEFMEHLKNDATETTQNDDEEESNGDDIANYKACDQCLRYAESGMCEPCFTKDFEILLEDHPCTFYMNRPCVECHCMLEELCNAYSQ